MKDKKLMNDAINKFCGTEGIDYLSKECGLSNLFEYVVPKLSEWGSHFYNEPFDAFCESLIGTDCVLDYVKFETGSCVIGIRVLVFGVNVEESVFGHSKDPAVAFGLALLQLIKSKE